MRISLHSEVLGKVWGENGTYMDTYYPFLSFPIDILHFLALLVAAILQHVCFGSLSIAFCGNSSGFHQKIAYDIIYIYL